MKKLLSLGLALGFLASSALSGPRDVQKPQGHHGPTKARWSAEKAQEWYSRFPWVVGANFLPSTAINQLEMWQADTFDPKTIDRELGWANKIGFNCMRVFLHDLAWKDDPEGFKKRINQYLEIADKNKIRTMFVLFDDCWNQNPQLGKQPAPKPGVHNSGWVQGPGSKIVTNPKEWGRLEKYVADILTTYGKDQRIVLWDLYNEPGNNNLHEKSLPFLKAVVGWAQKANPDQPLTVGTWYGNKKLNEYQLAISDVITFHNYHDANHLAVEIARLKKLGRPVICTEYMARTNKSKFQTHLPVFWEENVWAINWGLVSGKSQTIFPWGSPEGAKEPKVWFHDVFRPDGTPYDPQEVAVIREMRRRAK